MTVDVPATAPPADTDGPDVPGDFFTSAHPVGVVVRAAPGGDVTISEFSNTVDVGADPMEVVVCLGTLKLTPCSSYFFSEVGRATVVATVLTDSSN